MNVRDGRCGAPAASARKSRAPDWHVAAESSDRADQLAGHRRPCGHVPQPDGVDIDGRGEAPVGQHALWADPNLTVFRGARSRDLPPCALPPAGQARSQQPRARVIAEEFGIAHVAAQRVHTPMAALVHHLEDRGAAPRGRCEEAGPERMAGEELRIKPAGRSHRGQGGQGERSARRCCRELVGFGGPALCSTDPEKSAE
jgi:hypothetical protein